MSLEHIIAGQWSPHEKAEKIGNLKRKYTPEFCHKLAEKNGGKFLSTELTVINCKQPLLWEDSNGEKFIRCLYDAIHNKFISPKKSMGEYEISQFLKELNLNFTPHCRKTLDTGFELDFYIPSKKIAIEYHGLRWHTEEKLGRNYHLNKLKMAEKSGINLVQVLEHEWRNKTFQVKSFLKSKLGLNSQKIYARKCELREVPKKEANNFLNKNHIQGAGKFSISYGLYYKDELKMLIALGNHHRNNKKALVLTRCVSEFDVTVIGGLSKLCKYAKTLNGSFITWIDKRWSTGKSWESVGWKVEENLAPDYFYYHPDKKIIQSKQSRSKGKLPPPNGMTEREFAKEQGFERIYDAGKIRLRY